MHDTVTNTYWRGRNRALLNVTIRDRSQCIRDNASGVTAGGEKCHGNVTARKVH
jgi:hypothetical protein